MKTSSLLAVAGSLICFAVPAFAQKNETADSQTVQQRDLLGVPKALDDFAVLSLKLDEAFNKNDASAIAALFTEDGILVTSDGMFSGRQAIEKRYADIFQRWPITTFSGQRYQLNAIDNAVWSAGEWWSTIQSETGPKFDGGYWSAIYIHEGDDWKIRLLTVSGHPKSSRTESK
jgi:ketosteroid isomerase-like protein